MFQDPALYTPPSRWVTFKKTTTMTPKHFIIILLSISNYCFGQAHISGNIKNYNNKKVTVVYNSDGILFGKFTKIKTKTNEYGDFWVNADYLFNIGTYNWIKIGKSYIYFCLSPSDSLKIVFDPKKPDSIEFFGKNAMRSYYCNDHYQYLHKRRNTLRNFPLSDITVEKKKNDLIYDLAMLEKKNKEYSLDSTFYNYMKEYLKYSHINSLLNAKLDTTSYFIEILKEVDLQNEILKNNGVYISIMDAYYKNFLGFRWRGWDSVEGLQEGLLKSNELNIKPFSDIYSAFMISYFIFMNNKNNIIKSSEFKEVLTDFLNSCSDSIVKREFEALLHINNLN